MDTEGAEARRDASAAPAAVADAATAMVLPAPPIGLAMHEDESDADGALVAACKAGRADVVARLLVAGADVNPAPSRGAGVPLVIAANRGHVDVLELLLAGGADVRTDGAAGLVSACEGGHLPVVARLLEVGVNVRGRNDGALQAAVQHGHSDVLAHLLAHGAAAGDLDHALVRAVEENHVHLCDLLLAAGARVHTAHGRYWYSKDALHAAALRGRISVVQTFLERGAHAPATDRRRSLGSALVAASTAGHAEVVRVLLAAGADVHASNDEALVNASCHGRADVVPLLLTAGANVHANDNTALRKASMHGHLDIVAALLVAGAGVHTKDDMALASAAQSGHDKVVAQLLAAGADVRSRKYMALKCALKSEQEWQRKERVREHLLAAGAATWSPATDSTAAASTQMQFLGFINEVLALEARLEAASERGDLVDVDIVLGMSSLGNYVDVDGAFPQACRGGHERVVARLIAAGADVHHGFYDPNYGYVGPLVEACERGHLAIVQELVAAGADVNMLDGAPLALAAGAGHLDLIDWLLQHGADVHTNDENALESAAEQGQAAAVARLLAAGARIHARRGAVRSAVNSGEDVDILPVVRQLVEAGADLRTMDDDTLSLAAGIRGSLPLVELLLQAGADVHARDDGALVEACNYGHVAIVERLLDAGANVLRVVWTRLPEQARTRIVLRVPPADVEALPRWMRLVRTLHRACVRRALRCALARVRDRLDRPPTAALGVPKPTRDDLIAHLRTAGRRFAREYWTEGIPLFFPDLTSDLGPVPDEFVFCTPHIQ